MSISLQSVVVATPNQISSTVGGQEVILNLQSGVYYGLDAVGALIWKDLQTPHTVSEIRDTILARYTVDPARVEHDLIALLNRMCETGLIEIKNETRA